MKCDETKPSCSVCITHHLSCGGYEKRIFFDFENDDVASGAARFRRPLLTEKERESMSKEIVSSVRPSLALLNIYQIDEECENASNSRDIQISRGPFGVFGLTKQTETSPVSEELGTPSPTTLQQNINIPFEEPNAEAGPHDDIMASPPERSLSTKPSQPSVSYMTGRDSPSQRPRTPSYLNSMEDWWLMNSFDDMNGWSDGMLQPDSYRIQELPEDISLAELDTSPLPDATRHSPSSSALSVSHVLNPPLSPPQSLSIPAAIDITVPYDAVFLLKHYSTTVLQSLTPFRHSKTPWHVLFLPHAKSCLAALTLGESLDDASLCAFYGTLALSANSLAVISNSQEWYEQFRQYKQRALYHVRMMLKTAYDIPKKAKYKSLLLALLTIVQISSVSRASDQKEYYFLEAEKLIRVKGLNRRKSRKVRLLHHCYTFERLQHETTYPGTTQSPYRSLVRNAIETSGASVYSRDSLSFRPSEWANLDEAMTKVKDADVGENDLHLQTPGIWVATLYPEIFGVQEVYVLLLSLIICLGRAKNDVNSTDNLGLREFMRRAKSIEKRIHQLKKLPDVLMAEYDQRASQPLLEILCNATQQAIVIYLYRTLYDVDSSMLQSEVASIRDCLARYEDIDDGQGYGSVRLAWPAFIAAREAEDEGVRLAFLRWFNNNARRSGLRVFSDSQAELDIIWEEKRRNETSQNIGISYNKIRRFFFSLQNWTACLSQSAKIALFPIKTKIRL